jgi:hypothetical protein
MSAEIIIGIGGIVLSVLTYFAGVIRTEKRYKSQAREKRIDEFVNVFFSRYKGAGVVIELLSSSGIHNFQNDDEIMTALNALRNRLGFHPLRNWKDEIETIGYKKFFDFVLENKIQLDTKTIDRAIQDMQVNV